jgi:hypothetical protein
MRKTRWAVGRRAPPPPCLCFEHGMIGARCARDDRKRTGPYARHEWLHVGVGRCGRRGADSVRTVCGGQVAPQRRFPYLQFWQRHEHARVQRTAREGVGAAAREVQCDDGTVNNPGARKWERGGVGTARVKASSYSIFNDRCAWLWSLCRTSQHAATSNAVGCRRSAITPESKRPPARQRRRCVQVGGGGCREGGANIPLTVGCLATAPGPSSPFASARP